MPFRAKLNQPWNWERKKNRKQAMKGYYFRLHPTTLDLLRDVEVMYALYYNRRFDRNGALRHALQNANLNIRRSLRNKGLDPEPKLAEARAKIAARRARGIADHDDSPMFEGPAPEAGRIDIG